jgi:hypothetical protein
MFFSFVTNNQCSVHPIGRSGQVDETSAFSVTNKYCFTNIQLATKKILCHFFFARIHTGGGGGGGADRGGR